MLRDLLRRRLLDPLTHRVASRLMHLESMREATHDGSKWTSALTCGKGTRFYEEAAIANLAGFGALSVGEFCCIRGELSVISGVGKLHMGDYCFVGPGSRVWAATEVIIGNSVLISHQVDIHDTNAHSLDWRIRRDETIARFGRGEAVGVGPDVENRAVRIEDYAWIGFKASVLKGVCIGKGAVVAAASVVTKDVPPFCVVAGNPARIVRELPAK